MNDIPENEVDIRNRIEVMLSTTLAAKKRAAMAEKAGPHDSMVTFTEYRPVKFQQETRIYLPSYVDRKKVLLTGNTAFTPTEVS